MLTVMSLMILLLPLYIIMDSLFFLCVISLEQNLEAILYKKMTISMTLL